MESPSHAMLLSTALSVPSLVTLYDFRGLRVRSMCGLKN